MTCRIFSLREVNAFRAESLEASGRYARMSDTQLRLEALKRARIEVQADLEQAAIDEQLARERMTRLSQRKAELDRQIGEVS